MKPSYTVPESPQSFSPVDSYNVWPGGVFPLDKLIPPLRTRGGFHGDNSTRRRRRTRKGRKGKKGTRKAKRKGRK